MGAEKLLSNANFDFDAVLGTGERPNDDMDSQPFNSAFKGQSSAFASPELRQSSLRGGAESYVDAGADDAMMVGGFQSPRSYVDGGRRQRAQQNLVHMVPGGIASVTGRQYHKQAEAALVSAPVAQQNAYDPNAYSALPTTSADACFATFL